MSRVRKVSYDEIDRSFKDFTAKTRSHYRDHSYAAGFFASLAASLLVDMPAHRQRETMSFIQKIQEKLDVTC